MRDFRKIQVDEIQRMLNSFEKAVRANSIKLNSKV
jgi:hypothetical protein